MPIVKGIVWDANLDTSMATQVEIKLCGVGDPDVHGGASWNVATAADL